MPVWARLGAVVGCLVVVALLWTSPHGQDRGDRAEVVCRPVIGDGPLWVGDEVWVDALEGTDRYHEPVEPFAVCEHRRSARLALAVVAAVPTTALLGAWTAVTVMDRRASRPPWA